MLSQLMERETPTREKGQKKDRERERETERVQKEKQQPKGFIKNFSVCLVLLTSESVLSASVVAWAFLAVVRAGWAEPPPNSFAISDMLSKGEDERSERGEKKERGKEQRENKQRKKKRRRSPRERVCVYSQSYRKEMATQERKTKTKGRR